MSRTTTRVIWILVAVLVLYELSWSLPSAGPSSTPNPQSAARTKQNTTKDSFSPWRSFEQYTNSKLSGLAGSKSNGFPTEFPKKVWQTASEEGKVKWATAAQSWQDLEGWDYKFLNDDEADDFIDNAYTHAPGIQAFWHKLKSHVIRADLLRYLLMLAEGGVYSDIDTTCLVHPDLWVPSDIDVSTINAVMGIEYDDTTYPLFVWPISFSQWTLFAKPNHPIFQIAVARVMSNLEFLSRRKFQTFDELVVDKKEVLAATGPGMITDVVVQVIRDQGIDVTWESFHNITEPRVFGDVLVLPINGFAGNQKHSHSGNPAYGEKFVQHHFARSWYKHKPAAPEQKPIAEGGQKKSVDDTKEKVQDQA